MSERDGFPIMGRPGATRLGTIPWAVIELHSASAQRNHSQTVLRLAERGGLSPCEAVAVLEDRSWHRMEWDDAVAQLQRLTSHRLTLSGEGR